jgi:hypothetical protein
VPERHTVDTITDDALDALYDEREQLLARVGNALALHQPADDWSWKAFGCGHDGEHTQLCGRCRTCYPCPTARALDITPETRRA